MRWRIGQTEIAISFWFPALVSCAVFAGGQVMMVLGAVLIHEMGHAVLLTLVGSGVQLLRCDLAGLRIIPKPGRILSTGREIAVLVAGPLAGLLGAGVGALLGQCRFAWINLILLGFNLLPIRGLDGGSLLRLVCRYRWGEPGERYAGVIAAVLLAILMLCGWSAIGNRLAAIC